MATPTKSMAKAQTSSQIVKSSPSKVGPQMSAVSKPIPKEIAKAKQDQLQRSLEAGSVFLSGVLAINISQMMGAPLYLMNKDWYKAWMNFTKESFGILITAINQRFAPTRVKVSGDSSVRGQLRKTENGNLVCDFPERLVMIANHQIYTDWMYLWWIAYTNGMHGRVIIILKESLKRIPIIGWGMQLFQFIFMKRNWEKDKRNLAAHLRRLDKPNNPMWLLLFPEGTNLAPSTRKKSKKWAVQHKIKDMEHTLLPRSTGLHFCLQRLRNTVDYVYDCTIAYEGVPRGKYAQDIFTLQSSYMGGTPPKTVHMYWRRFKISEIPLDSPKQFERWLRSRWREKDMLIERFYQKGSFPPNLTPERKSAGHIDTQIRTNYFGEFLQVFAPLGLVALVLSSFYGALPKMLAKGINKRAVQEKIAAVQRYKIEPFEAKMILGPQELALLRKVEAARQSKMSLDEQKLLLGPAGKAILQKLMSQPVQMQKPQPKMLKGPPTRLTPKNLASVEAAINPASKMLSNKNGGVTPSVSTNMFPASAKSVVSTVTRAPSVISMPTGAKSVVSLPTGKSPGVQVRNRAASVGAAPHRKPLTAPAPSRATSVLPSNSIRKSTTGAAGSTTAQRTTPSGNISKTTSSIPSLQRPLTTPSALAKPKNSTSTAKKITGGEVQSGGISKIARNTTNKTKAGSNAAPVRSTESSTNKSTPTATTKSTKKITQKKPLPTKTPLKPNPLNQKNATKPSSESHPTGRSSSTTTSTSSKPQQQNKIS